MITPALRSIEPGQRDQLQAELRPAEQLVWGSGAVPKFWSAEVAKKTLFGIPFTAFAIFWTVMASGAVRNHGGRSSGGAFQYFFPLWGCMFIAFGLAMLTTPIWYARRLRRTIYAITNQRAIVIAPEWFGAAKVQSYYPGALTTIERIEYGDGIGDLVFEHYEERHGRGTRTIRKGFISIDGVRAVEDLLRRTLPLQANV